MNGQWAKKVLGRLHYFGVWDDPAAEERLWDAQKDDLLAGHEPRLAAVINDEQDLMERTPDPIVEVMEKFRHLLQFSQEVSEPQGMVGS